MKLPTHLLLCLAAACEPAHEAKTEQRPITIEDDVPLDEAVRMTTHDDGPAAAPRFAQPPAPQPQPSPPPPKVTPKKKPAKVWANICGHTELVEAGQGLVKCGMG